MSLAGVREVMESIRVVNYTSIQRRIVLLVAKNLFIHTIHILELISRYSIFTRYQTMRITCDLLGTI
jgi:hypothetical protein